MLLVCCCYEHLCWKGFLEDIELGAWWKAEALLPLQWQSKLSRCRSLVRKVTKHQCLSSRDWKIYRRSVLDEPQATSLSRATRRCFADDLQLWRRRGKVDLLEEPLQVDQDVEALRAKIYFAAASECCIRFRAVKRPCAQLAIVVFEIWSVRKPRYEMNEI